MSDQEIKDKMKRLYAALLLNINPYEDEDMGIIIEAALYEKLSDDKLEEFNDRVNILLKHDWERVKWEITPFFLRKCEPKRVKYNEYKIYKECMKAKPYMSCKKLSVKEKFKDIAICCLWGFIWAIFTMIDCLFNQSSYSAGFYVVLAFFIWRIVYLLLHECLG
jgi:hypothetical protein